MTQKQVVTNQFGEKSINTVEKSSSLITSIIVIGAGTDVVKPLFLANFKAKIISVKMIQESGIGANDLSLQLKKNDVLIGGPVASPAGLAARTALVLNPGTNTILEVGDYLALDIKETSFYLGEALFVLEFELVA